MFYIYSFVFFKPTYFARRVPNQYCKIKTWRKRHSNMAAFNVFIIRLEIDKCVKTYFHYCTHAIWKSTCIQDVFIEVTFADLSLTIRFNWCVLQSINIRYFIFTIWIGRLLIQPYCTKARRNVLRYIKCKYYNIYFLTFFYKLATTQFVCLTISCVSTMYNATS